MTNEAPNATPTANVEIVFPVMHRAIAVLVWKDGVLYQLMEDIGGGSKHEFQRVPQFTELQGELSTIPFKD